MADEKSFFIQVLSDHLNKRKTALKENIDWSRVVRLSLIHQVDGILFYQCKEFIPKNEYARLEQRYYSTIYYYKNREKLLAKIDKEFSANTIPYIEIKGLKIAKYYPVPGLRTMGDTDLVVHEEDRERASDVLSKIGFVHQYEFTGKERGFSSNHINVELHHHLIYDEVVSLVEHERFFNNCWKYVKHGELNHSFHFLFLLTHIRKHMMNEGVGIRQFMDLAVEIMNDSTLNWEWITEKLKELQLLKFAYACFGMIEYWFGIKAPVEYIMRDEEFYKQATERVLKNGVFGFDDKDNRRNHMANRIRTYDGPKTWFRIKIIIERAFPSYKFLRESDFYRFLDGRPWLLPAAWCYRFYLMAIEKTTSVGSIVEGIMQSNEALEARDGELRQWGLID